MTFYLECLLWTSFSPNMPSSFSPSCKPKKVTEPGTWINSLHMFERIRPWSFEGKLWREGWMVERRSRSRVTVLQSCSSPRKLCANYRLEIGIKNFHTQFECKELWGRQLDVEYEAFKEGGGGEGEKNIRFLWRLKAWAFGALLQLELTSFLMCLMFSSQLILWESLPSYHRSGGFTKKISPLWFLDFTGHCVNVL